MEQKRSKVHHKMKAMTMMMKLEAEEVKQTNLRQQSTDVEDVDEAIDHSQRQSRHEAVKKSFKKTDSMDRSEHDSDRSMSTAETTETGREEQTFERQLARTLVEDPDLFRRVFSPALAACLATAQSKLDMHPVEKQDFAFDTFRTALKDHLQNGELGAVLIKEDSMSTLDSGSNAPNLKRGTAFHAASRRDLFRSSRGVGSIRAVSARGVPSLRSTPSASEDSLMRDTSFGEDVIAALEDEIFDLEDEVSSLKKHIKKQKRRHNELAELYQNQQQRLFELEEKYALLKVELATAQASLDDEQLESSKAIADRDLLVMNLTLERDEEMSQLSRVVKEKDAMTIKLARLEDSIQEKNRRLLTLVTERDDHMSDLRRMNRQLDSLNKKVEHYEEMERQQRVDAALGQVASSDFGSRRSSLMRRFTRRRRSMSE